MIGILNRFDQDAWPELSDVLSAKNHELGYSTIINSSVGHYDPLKGLKKYAFPGISLKTAVRNTVKYTGVHVCIHFFYFIQIETL